MGVITTWKTPFSTHFSHKPYAWATVVLGSAALVFSFINFVAPQLFEPHPVMANLTPAQPNTSSWF